VFIRPAIFILPMKGGVTGRRCANTRFASHRSGSAPRPLPQRLRPARHTGRRPRKGAGGHLLESDGSEEFRQIGDRHLGEGTQTRSFTYIDDCLKGINMIMHCDRLIATPINLGSSESFG